jgi:hypothetical protein
MNRGSALKWVQELESTDWVYDWCQLRYDHDGKKLGSPFGVLANFLDPSGWKLAWDGVSYTWHGSQFTLSTEFLKRIKMKHNIYDNRIEFGGNIGTVTIHEVECMVGSFKEFAFFLEQHYEVL